MARTLEPRSSPGRIFLAFAYFFGVIILPVGVALLVGLLGPNRFLPEESRLAFADGVFVDPNGVLGPEASNVPVGHTGELAHVRAQYPDGTVAHVYVFAAAGEVTSAADAIQADLVTTSSGMRLSETFYTKSDGVRGWMIPTGRYLVRLEGPDSEAIGKRAQLLPAVPPNPKKNPILVLATDGLRWLIVGILLYTILQVFIWGRVGSWATRVEPPPGTEPVSAEELRGRLMAINELDVPFSVLEGTRPDELIVEWKYVDAKWLGLMEAGAVKGLHRIKLRLTDPKRGVRAQDTHYRFKAELLAGNLTDGRLVGGFQWNFFRGITLVQYDRESRYGLYVRHRRLQFDAAYRYRFSVAEMKNPIIEIVTTAGWNYVPVITFNRALNG